MIDSPDEVLEDAELPISENHHRQRHRDQLRNEAQCCFIDRCGRLDHPDQQTDDEGYSKQWCRNKKGHPKGLSSDIYDGRGIHDVAIPV